MKLRNNLGKSSHEIYSKGKKTCGDLGGDSEVVAKYDSTLNKILTVHRTLEKNIKAEKLSSFPLII